MSTQTEKQLADLLARLQYKYKDLAKRDVTQALVYFKELMPKLDQHTYPNGLTKELISLSGTIPVNFKNNRYNIPIQLYLADTHPYTPPICYVRPTSDMCINVSETVDSNGRVMLPCIADWQYPKSDLYMLINFLSIRFSEQTPLYSKPSGVAANAVASATTNANVSSNSVPYPMDNFSRPSYPMPTATSTYSMGGQTPFPANDAVLPPYATATTANPYYPMPQPISHLKSGQSNSQIGVVRPPPFTTPTPVSNPQTQPQTAYSDDTIKPEYYRMSLITAIEDKIRKKFSESYEEKMAEIDSLKRVRNDLENSQQYLTTLINDSESECSNIRQLTGELKRRTQQLSESISRIEHRDKANIEDAVVTTTPLYRQLLHLFAEEMAIQDLIFYLSEGLTHKTISLENFLKQVRFLSRKQFNLRATMNLAREKAHLPL